jgi:hypothetical protein
MLPRFELGFIVGLVLFASVPGAAQNLVLNKKLVVLVGAPSAEAIAGLVD